MGSRASHYSHLSGSSGIIALMDPADSARVLTAALARETDDEVQVLLSSELGKVIDRLDPSEVTPRRARALRRARPPKVPELHDGG